MNKLFNDYELKGINEADMMNDLKDFSDMTMLKNILSYEMIVYAIVTTVKGGLKVMEFYPDDMEVRNICSDKFLKEHMDVIPYDDFKKIGISDELIREIIERGYFLKIIGEDGKGTIIIPSPNLQNMLTHICGAGKLKDEGSPINYIYLAYLLSDVEKFSMIIRKQKSVAKGFAAFSDCHTLERQDDKVRKMLEIIRKLHPECEVKHYSITHTKTEIELGLEDLKTAKRTSTGSKYLITPSFFLSLADTGDYASTIEAALDVNGRNIKIGEPIYFDTDNIEALLTEEIVNFNRFLDRLEEESDSELFNMKTNVIKIMKKLGYYKLGKKYVDLYDSYMEGFPENATRIEILMEILIIPSKIIYLYNKRYNEFPKPYIIEKMSKISGKVFDLDMNKECI